MDNPAQSIREGSPSEPTAVDTAYLDHRFRFTERGNPVVEALYALASEKLLQENTEPRNLSRKSDKAPLAPIDPVDIVQLEVRLPPLPATLAELQEVLHRRNFSTDNVAAVIAKDPGLAAWLLKLVNSPYYGFSAKVATISRAVALVGTRQIQTLAVGGALNSLASLIPKGLLPMEQFWRHSIATGIIAQELWRLSGRKEPEQLFVSGLLHDCGRLALAYATPSILKSFNARFDYGAGPCFVAEKEMLGFDHARLGGMLLHRWNMPLPLVISVLRHHEVEDSARYPEAAAVHVADAMASALGIGEHLNAPAFAIYEGTWDTLGLQPEALAEVASVLYAKFDDLCLALRS